MSDETGSKIYPLALPTQTWEVFVRAYSEALNELKTGASKHKLITAGTYALSYFIVNLPGFESYDSTVVVSKVENSRSRFFFCNRQVDPHSKALTLSISMRLPHATIHPQTVTHLFKTWQNNWHAEIAFQPRLQAKL